MAQVTLNVPNADVPDIFAALNSAVGADAVRIFASGSQATFDAATQLQRAQWLIAALIAVTTRNYRTAQLAANVAKGAEPGIT